MIHKIRWRIFPRFVGTGWLVCGFGKVVAIAVIKEIGVIGLILRFTLEKNFDTIAMSDLVGLWVVGLQLYWCVDAVFIGLSNRLIQVKVQKAVAVD